MASLITFQPESRGGVQENQFNYAASITGGDGVEVLYNYPVYLTQMVAGWTTASVMTVSVELPSGTSFTIEAYASGTSLTLNSRSENYVYWTQLPAGSRVVFSSSATITKFNVSIISNQI